MKVNKHSAFLLGLMTIMFVYWIGIELSDITDLPVNLYYSVGITIVAFVGGVMGLFLSKKWGGDKSAVGKAILYLSLGTTVWSVGSIIWSFYNLALHQEVPYPSLADIGYISAIPLWSMGIFSLSKATGARFSLKANSGRILFIFLPLIATAISYYLLFIVARDSSFDWQGGVLKVFFDLAYPVGDWVILTFAFLIWGLSLKYLGGHYRWPVFIVLLGFLTMFLADFSFSYTTTVETYYNGSYPDFLFAFAMFLLGFGINSFNVSGKETN